MTTNMPQRIRRKTEKDDLKSHQSDYVSNTNLFLFQFMSYFNKRDCRAAREMWVSDCKSHISGQMRGPPDQIASVPTCVSKNVNSSWGGSIDVCKLFVLLAFKLVFADKHIWIKEPFIRNSPLRCFFNHFAFCFILLRISLPRNQLEMYLFKADKYCSK